MFSKLSQAQNDTDSVSSATMTQIVCLLLHVEVVYIVCGGGEGLKERCPEGTSVHVRPPTPLVHYTVCCVCSVACSSVLFVVNVKCRESVRVESLENHRGEVESLYLRDRGAHVTQRCLTPGGIVCVLLVWAFLFGKRICSLKGTHRM